MSTLNSIRPPTGWAAKTFNWIIKAFVVLFAIIGLAENVIVIKEEVADKIKVDVLIADPSATKIDFTENESKVKTEVDFAVHLSLTNIYSRPITIESMEVNTLCSVGKERWTEAIVESVEDGNLTCFNKQKEIAVYPVPRGGNLGARLTLLSIDPSVSLKGWLIGELPRKSSNRIEQIKIKLRTHEGDIKEILVVIPKVAEPMIKKQK